VTEPDTSASLLIRIRNPSDAEAWADFVRIYSPLLRRYCQRKGLQEADSADVAQEVMLKISHAIRSFEYSREQGKFRNWLGVLTRHEIANNLTRNGRLPVLADVQNVTQVTEDPDWNHDYTNHVLQLALCQIRGEFRPDVWAAFEATWLANEPPLEVANRLQMAVHAVYVNKSRVLKRLATEVMKLAEELPIAPS
jgi:RNA polymerase sigma-70 factor, ECF subfamily